MSALAVGAGRGRHRLINYGDVGRTDADTAVAAARLSTPLWKVAGLASVAGSSSHATCPGSLMLAVGLANGIANSQR